jgi:hypothetical protein
MLPVLILSLVANVASINSVSCGLSKKVLIFKIEVFATALLAIHKKNVYRDNQ